MRVFGFLTLAATMTGLLGCEDQPCRRYVDYICECHPDDEAFDCVELENTLIGSEQAVQDQCAIDLADQQAIDDENGLACDII